MSVSGRKGWWRPDAWAPALLIIAPFFINKLIYARWPSYPVFLVTDYTCHILSLGLVYLLLRNTATHLPIPFRLAVPSSTQLTIGLAGAALLVAANVVGVTFFRHLDAHSWRLTRFPAPTNLAVQGFDVTVGVVLAGISEEVVFRFYFMNLFLARGASMRMTIVLSSLIFCSNPLGRTALASQSLRRLPACYFQSVLSGRAIWSYP
jgi:membrane protease YdiL (CAAX protease family)